MFQLGFDSFWSTGTGLHTSIILILSEWWAACSVILFIKIEKMEEFNESKDPLIVFKDVMEKLDSLVPFPSAKLAWSCQTEHPVDKIIFPGIYSVCLPLSLVVSTYLLSVVLMTAVVPLANKLGKPLEVVGKKTKHEKKRRKAEEKLMAHLADGAMAKMKHVISTWPNFTHPARLQVFQVSKTSEVFKSCKRGAWCYVSIIRLPLQLLLRLLFVDVCCCIAGCALFGCSSS